MNGSMKPRDKRDNMTVFDVILMQGEKLALGLDCLCLVQGRSVFLLKLKCIVTWQQSKRYTPVKVGYTVH